MNKKKEQTLLATASDKVKGFNKLIEKFRKNISIQGKSDSTFKNHDMHLATMALHFDCLPKELDEDQINGYLYLLKTKHETPSDFYFKHTV